MSTYEQLLSAIVAHDRDGIRQAIAAGANVNQRSDDGVPVLFVACLEGHIEVVQLLLDHGADPNLEATEPGQWEYAKTAVDLVLGAQFLVDWDRYTPILELLLARGATDSEGHVPATEQINNRRDEAMAWQCSRGTH